MHRKCYILFLNLYSIFGAFKVYIWKIITYIVFIPYEFCYVQILGIYLKQVKKYSIKCMPVSDLFFFIAINKKMRPISYLQNIEGIYFKAQYLCVM